MSLVATIKTIQRAVGATPDGVFGPRTAAAVLAELARRDDGGGEAPALLDARTVANIETLDIKAQQRFWDFALLAKATAATYGCDYIAICGHRTWAEQDALYAQRPKVTNAPGGYSNHNFGIAADFGVFRGKVYLDESSPALAAQVHAACAVHAAYFGLVWGGTWISFPDAPHYEVVTGLTLTEKRDLYEREGSLL